MATKRKEIIRLLSEGCSQNEVCVALRCSKRDVSAVAKLLQETQIDEEALADLRESDIRQLVLPGGTRESSYVQPDFDYIISELSRPHVTRKLLWYEYTNTTVPEGKSLSIRSSAPSWTDIWGSAGQRPG